MVRHQLANHPPQRSPTPSAYRAGDEGWQMGKVKALQRLLTCSYSGKVLAVRRVTENSGKKAPGVDREIWDTPEKKTRAVSRTRTGTFFYEDGHHARDERFRLPRTRRAQISSWKTAYQAFQEKHQDLLGWHSKNDQSRAW